MKRRIFTFFLLLYAGTAFAENAPILPARDVSLEWETTEGAVTYDVEVTRKPKANSKPEVYNTKDSIWKGRLSPGFYEMRVRSKDRRRVPGDWSEAVELTVMLEPPQSTDLKNHLRIDAKDPERSDVPFRWGAVPGADSYELKIEGPDGQVFKTLEVSETSLQVELPVGREYKWSLIAKNREGLTSETPLKGHLELWGPMLERPQLEEPPNPFVRELKWQNVPYAQSVHYTLQIKDATTNKWKNVDAQKEFTGDKFAFAPSWPGGNYRLNVRSQAGFRKNSKISTIQFNVADGDRSEEAEYAAMLRQSIVRTTGWFVVASYLVTGMAYSGINADNGGSAPLQVDLPNNFGGTGRIGTGWISGRSPWGFLGIADLSGFTVAGQNPTFMSLEFSAVRRTIIGRSGEFRQKGGIFYKELPEIIARDLNGIDRIDKIIAAGPQYGIEYWWALSPKLGFQVNAQAYASLMSVKTPTGNPVAPSLSYQAGLLGSYRITERASGLIGYAYRQDSQAYKSSHDRTNTVKITGHYLNLFLEWAL
ncbi:MAG: hypothetical protein KF767_14390 [Bdellovibrionaceae bacterium]|nr:hypothetical protein [Pseudobdellovibrionaceae bacterium]